MGNPRVPLNFNACYHVYNYAVGTEKLFRERRNYFYFLDKLQKWIAPVVEIKSWSLTPDHFRLCIRVRSRQKIETFFNKQLQRNQKKLLTSTDKSKFLRKLIIAQFSHCFNSYAQGYNKTYRRQGALFRESFYRELLRTQTEIDEVNELIRMDAVRCGIVSSPEKWNFCSHNDSFSRIKQFEYYSPGSEKVRIPEVKMSKLLSELLNFS